MINNDIAPNILKAFDQRQKQNNKLSIFINKPAPVQITWLGCLSSTGIPEIDYIIGDPYTFPKDLKRIFEPSPQNISEQFSFVKTFEKVFSDPLNCSGIFQNPPKVFPGKSF